MTAGTYQSIRIERRGHSAWITLNRPDVINAINTPMRKEIPAALDSLDADPDVRVIVITGAGPRGFCAGADIKEPAADKHEGSESATTSWIERFDEIAVPIIAAVHGFCLGGGLEIALACDIRIADDDASFGLPETRLGLIPGGGGTQRLSRLIGHGRAIELMMSGRRIDAFDAEKLGLVTRLPEHEGEFLDSVRAYVDDLASRPPLALRAVKKAVREGSDKPLAEGLRLERMLFAGLVDTEDRKEAATAFAEKRGPVFKGK